MAKTSNPNLEAGVPMPMGAKGPFNSERSPAGIMPTDKYVPWIGNGRPVDNGMVDGDNREIPMTDHARSDGGASFEGSLAGNDPSILVSGYRPIAPITDTSQSDGMDEA